MSHTPDPPAHQDRARRLCLAARVLFAAARTMDYSRNPHLWCKVHAKALALAARARDLD